MNPSSWPGRFEGENSSAPSIVIAFLWGLAEATLFFIVPDVYLGLVALFNWRRGVRATAAAVVGAMVGGAVMYTLAAHNGDALMQLLTRVPLVNRNMMSGIGDQMRREGLLAMVTGPLRGIPYKVYAVQAGVQQLPFWLFLFFTIPARLERLLPVTCAFSVIGAVFKKTISRRVALVLCAYGLMWLVIYVLYYLRFR